MAETSRAVAIANAVTITIQNHPRRTMSWITFKEKQEQRAKLIHDAGELLKTAKKEERELTPDENTRFEQMHTDADRLANEVEQLRKQIRPSEVSKPVSVENQSKHHGRKELPTSTPPSASGSVAARMH